MKAKISVNPGRQIGLIDENIYGHFLEMTYHCFFGGLWAEMLKHRKFEADDGEGNQYGVVKPWYPIGRTAEIHFVHDNSIYYCGSQSQKIASKEGPSHRVGVGQGELLLESSQSYEVRLNIKQEDVRSPITVALEGEGGVYARQEIILPDTDWTRCSFVLRSSRTDPRANFTITYQGGGTLWLGTASLMATDHISGYRRDVIEAIRAIRPPNIRWPGGNFVSYYHWEDGIGDRDRRPPRPNYARCGVRGEEWESHEEWEANDVGIDEFMELCRLTGAKPYMAVNSGDGTPEEAARLVEYCNGKVGSDYGSKRLANGHSQPYGIALWGIGNESYGNWQGGHIDEGTYARRHLAIAKAMRAVDPTIKIVAVGARSWFCPHWNEVLLNVANGFTDYISLHSYAKKYRRHMKKKDLENPGFAREFYYYIVSSPYGIEEQIDLTAREIRSLHPNGPDISIAFDEWNCWAYNEPRHEVEFALRDGLYTAGVFHAFRRQCSVVRLANISMLVNCLPLIRVNQVGLFLNPQYLVFKMYLDHQGPTLVQSSVECDSFPAPEYEASRPQAIGRIPYLDASATLSEDGKTLYLAVINRHDSEPAQAGISVEGWMPASKGKMVWLDGEHYMTENTFESPRNITVEVKEVEWPRNDMTISFPEHSVTILELYRR
jgi:alpha-N-arabinofuranosidase